ncbi:Beta-barrel assembly machine subunit BamA [Aliiroseovarius halocynthiae]|uniref:Outer membrane protein assembly factor BamA n=1 Tax=Aliiroseovarius halocynthiae TaxID=985055 RepID=A0A545SWA0_9RHOB|nr:outer membrane protein assembly factor BamA [Aliiroseovarius halocynthiae]TQV69239.1 outer membrane protein assembly factor BamA [Aliiroseovarius halocynthiae]SMR72007.1 Beta-barrel assembly machine subunit BamA [Aliiroseovarius halocynthiae]
MAFIEGWGSVAGAPAFKTLKGLANSSGLAIFLAISGGAATTPTPAQAQVYSFSRVEIEGTQRIEAATILSYLGIAQGETVGAAQLNDGYQRLVGSGLFEDVQVVPRGNTLVVKVREYPTINVVSVEGNRKVKDSVFLPLLKSQSRRVFSPAAAEQDVQTIVEVYQAQGRLAARVTPRIIRRANNRVDLVFEVIEGKNTEVERLSFVGNRKFSDSRLRRVLATKQAGILRALVQKDSYVPDRIEFDKRVLKDFYQSRGYVDFKTTGVTSEFSRERDAFFITFQVEEGIQYRFGDITVVSEVNGVDAAEFEAIQNIRSGNVFSPAQLDNVVARMERLAIRNGLDFLRVEPRVTRDERNQLLNVELVLTRGPRIIVERIDIEGNATTLDRVVRDQFRVVEGDPFNPREIREATERVRALGFFADAQVEARPGSAPDQVVIDVDVEEAPTGSLGIGAVYSLESGIGFNIAFTERNFLGRGQFLSASFQRGSDNLNFSFRFAEPAFLGRDLEFGFETFYQSTNQASARYNTRSLAFRPSLAFPISEYSRLGVRVYADGTEITGVSADSSQLLKDDAARGRQIGGGLGLSYSYDTRRTGLDPSRGFLFKLDGDIGGIGSDYQYARATALAQAQTKVWNDQVTLLATVEGGLLHSLNGASSRVTDRFRLGPSKLRGFSTNGLGPRDLNAVNQDTLGGNMFAVARLEAQFPLGLPEEYGITGGLFADAGTLWGLDDTLGGTIDDSAHLRSSIGASIFWDTPIGPLRFNYSKVLAKESYDAENNFELTISAQF